GVVLIGAVHDYLSLMISVRNRGTSLAEVARGAVSPAARVLFLAFVWIGLVLVVTAFCNAAVGTFVSAPEIVLPTFSLVGIAVLFGFLTHRLGLNTVVSTVIALGLLVGVIGLGFVVPIELQDFGVPEESVQGTWIVILLVYGMVASVLPVWVLLQPRDYIATWILIFGMGLGYLGIAWVHPEIKAPGFTTAMSASRGPIWPMLFILVACGAVSGFHSLVAGGTTSKQLASERHGRLVGYGSMLVEGGLALMSLIAVSAGLYYTATQAGGRGPALQTILAEEGKLVAFGRGYNVLTRPILGPLGEVLGLPRLGLVVGLTMVNAFVMTTLDTSVRLTRFITTELAGPPLRVFRNRFVATLPAVVVAYVLAVQKDAFDQVWPMFGAANQLIAALALMTITAYLLQRGKPTLYTVIPALFMLATTMAALVWQAYDNLVKADVPNYTMGVTALVLLVLAGVLVHQGRRALIQGLSARRAGSEA
ncbi:MAG: carbon starvation protein A, partial [Candidatus Brocadiia bacterium]